jgi:hypothetical protein
MITKWCSLLVKVFLQLVAQVASVYTVAVQKSKHFSTVLWFWIAGSLTLIVLLAAILNFSAERAALLEETGELNRQSLLQSEQNLRLQDENIRVIARALYLHPDTTRLLYDIPGPEGLMETFTILDQFRNSVVLPNPLVHSLYFFNFSHDIHYSTWGRAFTIDPELQTTIRQLMKAGSLGRLFTRQWAGTTVLSLVQLDSWDAAGNPERGFVINLDALKIVEYLRGSMLSPERPDEALVVLDGFGQAIGPVLRNLPDFTGLAAATVSEQASVHTLAFAGREFQVSVLRLPFNDWTQVKLRPADQVYRRLTGLAWWLVGLTALVLLLGGLVSLAISRRLYPPG